MRRCRGERRLMPRATRSSTTPGRPRPASRYSLSRSPPSSLARSRVKPAPNASISEPPGRLKLYGNASSAVFWCRLGIALYILGHKISGARNI